MINPQGIKALVKRGADRGAEVLAERLGAAVEASGSERLEALMGSPARHPVLEAIFWQMPKHLDTERARGVDTGLRWRVTSRQGAQVDVYDLLVSGDQCRVERGGGKPPPPLTITVDGAEFLRLATGRSDPIQAYFKRRIALSGDIMSAAKLVSLFRIPGSRTVRRPA